MTGADLDLVLAAVGEVSVRATRPVVAVDGPSGAGKSTLCDAMADAVDGAVLVRLDDIYPGWDGLAAALPVLVTDVLVPWCAGEAVAFTSWDWSADAPGERHLVPAGTTLIVDGVGSGSLACAAYIDLLVWLDGPEPERYARAMARDGETYRSHWERWATQERALFAADRTCERADLRLGPDPCRSAPPG